jgi:hypothetical protein
VELLGVDDEELVAVGVGPGFSHVHDPPGVVLATPDAGAALACSCLHGAATTSGRKMEAAAGRRDNWRRKEDDAVAICIGRGAGGRRMRQHRPSQWLCMKRGSLSS